MKSSNGIVSSVFALGLGAASLATAVERPADMDDQIPTLAKEEIAIEGNRKRVATIEVRPEAELQQAGTEIPYLGVGSVPISDLLAGHLGLSFGVTILRVHEGSGADVAGLKNSDILTIFDGREIRSPLDLRDAVKACKVGQEVTVSVVRKGIKEDFTVTLAGRPAGLPHFAAEDEKDLGQLQQVWPGGGDSSADAMGQIRELIHEFDNLSMGLRMTDIIDGQLLDSSKEQNTGVTAQSSVTWADADGDINLKMSDGDTVVTVRDREGKVTYSGPWNTESEKSAVDANIRSRIENMGVSSQGNQLRLKSRRGLSGGR